MCHDRKKYFLGISIFSSPMDGIRKNAKMRDQLIQEKMQQKQHQITANEQKQGTILNTNCLFCKWGRSKTKIQYPFIQHLIAKLTPRTYK